MTAFFDIPVLHANGASQTLAPHCGKVVLVVNTASACGFTPQYAALQALQAQYEEQGFQVLAFPCNQFGKQEPGNDVSIGMFCERHYGVTFPILAKIDVNGPQAAPLFTFLKRQATGVLGSRSIKWNFTKFLIDRDGNVVKRYAPFTKPQNMVKAIEALLNPV